ncbi:MAG: cofactor-independent phosphoglycerate mutase [Candidatus Latescibacterota bacterium]|nr:cofactor-independent phosphoglycerate mutase [Candidatus Latescibacterota bacterium]
MKYVILVPDGAADYPVDELDGRTPLQAASTPTMDRLAREGSGGLVQMIPDSRHPGSDVGNLEIFGYDSTRHYTGRAPLEAVSMGIDLSHGAIAYRCNLIYQDGDKLMDYSAGHVTTEEARELIEEVDTRLGTEQIRFFPGVSYRHIMRFQGGPEGLEEYPPHDIMGESASAHLPRGERQEEIRALMERAKPILKASETNKKRLAAGQVPANAIWLWGAGRALTLESVQQRYGLQAGVISAVDLIRGIGTCAGYEVIDVPGVTGYLDTNYEGKAQYALDALRNGKDLLYVHVEAPDEAGHNADIEGKVQAIEDFDSRVAAPILEGLMGIGEPGRILMTPDHRTPLAIRTHTREPVPFVLWGEGVGTDEMDVYAEDAAEAGGLFPQAGHELIEALVRGPQTIDN